MKTKTKKIISYAVLSILISGAALYISMEEYQKDNMARFLSQTFASSE